MSIILNVPVNIIEDNPELDEYGAAQLYADSINQNISGVTAHTVFLNEHWSIQLEQQSN